MANEKIMIDNKLLYPHYKYFDELANALIEMFPYARISEYDKLSNNDPDDGIKNFSILININIAGEKLFNLLKKIYLLNTEYADFNIIHFYFSDSPELENTPSGNTFIMFAGEYVATGMTYHLSTFEYIGKFHFIEEIEKNGIEIGLKNIIQEIKASLYKQRIKYRNSSDRKGFEGICPVCDAIDSDFCQMSDPQKCPYNREI